MELLTNRKVRLTLVVVVLVAVLGLALWFAKRAQDRARDHAELKAVLDLMCAGMVVRHVSISKGMEHNSMMQHLKFPMVITTPELDTEIYARFAGRSFDDKPLTLEGNDLTQLQAVHATIEQRLPEISKRCQGLDEVTLSCPPLANGGEACLREKGTQAMEALGSYLRRNVPPTLGK